MKKLALFMLLSVTAPLFAVISDAEYAQEVQAELQHFQDQRDLTHRKIREQIVSHPLHQFASAGNLPVVQYLIEVKHVDPTETIYENGMDVTALDLAEIYGRADVADYLKAISRKTRLQ